MTKPLHAPRPRGRTALTALRSRSGAIGVAFAVGATTLLGMGALASEEGLWLRVRRNAQNAADAAAYAGALTLSRSGSSAVDGVATDVATRNGFTHNVANSTVTVAVETWGTNSTPNAVRVNIWQTQSTGLARLINTAQPVAWGGAVAVLQPGGNACTLSIPFQGRSNLPPQVDGSTYIGGSVDINAPNCIIASNLTGRKSIEIGGNNAAAWLDAAALRASGQCYRCADVPPNQIPGGYASNAAETPNPYAALDDRTTNPMPTFTCQRPVYRNASGAIVNWRGNNPPNNNDWTTVSLPVNTTNANPAVAVCDMTVDIPGNNAGTQSMNLAPGTYYFNRANLTASAASTITCSSCDVSRGLGVTMVFTDTITNNVANASPGYIRLTGGTFNLNAPGTGQGVPSVYDGVLIYRDPIGGPANAASSNIRIEGNASSTIFGGIYAPSSEVQISGSSLSNPPTGSGYATGCTAFVAGKITFTGNASIDIRACDLFGTKIARTFVVRLVQ